jgi:hypothetical protein
MGYVSNEITPIRFGAPKELNLFLEHLPISIHLPQERIQFVSGADVSLF